MSQENVELARRIYSLWERGDYSDVSWAADDIDFDLRFVPPTRVRGVHAMGRAWAAALKDWRGFSTRAAEFRDRGDRIVVTTIYGGFRDATYVRPLCRAQRQSDLARSAHVSGAG